MVLPVDGMTFNMVITVLSPIVTREMQIQPGSLQSR
jgi:hypothetical protein